MNDKKDGVARDQDPRPRKKFRLGQLIYHNSFVLACSFIAALVGWFVMAAGSDMGRTFVIKDVPIEITLSAEAEADGIRVFNSTYSTVDIEVSGSTLITSKLTPEDFQVTAALNPTSTKLTGNTLQKMTASVRAAKVSSISDYEIVSVSPEEINIDYDRYKELPLAIEPEVTFTADTGYHPGSAGLSEEKLTISGPESSVNKVSRAAVVYTMNAPLRATEEFSCPVTLFDQNNQSIDDPAGLYLSMDVESVQVTLPVMPKKTVPLAVTTAHMPSGFSEGSRISIEPKEIDIAGAQENLDAVTEIRLDTVIDFADLDIHARTPSFQVEIPVPAGTRNISNTSTNSVGMATVTVNLNGYGKATVTVPEGNIQLINPPSGGLDVQLTTRTLDVEVAGPEAQVNKLTGDSITVQVDMSNVAGRTGSVDVPATATVTGASGEACWVLGTYTMTVTMSEPSEEGGGASPSSRSIAASPQE